MSNMIAYDGEFYDEFQLADAMGKTFDFVARRRLHGGWLPHIYIEGQYYYNKQWADHYIANHHDYEYGIDGCYLGDTKTLSRRGENVKGRGWLVRLVDRVRR